MLQSIVWSTLGTSVDASVSLMSSDLDSITGVELVQTLSSESGLELTPMMLFDHPTLDSIASFLSSEVADDEAVAIASTGGESEDLHDDRAGASSMIGLADVHTAVGILA